MAEPDWGDRKRPGADDSGEDSWTAPFYDRNDPVAYHTRLDCPVGAAVPRERRRLAVAAMRARLPGW
jgi:hypothetical protein